MFIFFLVSIPTFSGTIDVYVTQMNLRRSQLTLSWQERIETTGFREASKIGDWTTKHAKFTNRGSASGV